MFCNQKYDVALEHFIKAPATRIAIAALIQHLLTVNYFEESFH